jgi:hypothetical protein
LANFLLLARGETVATAEIMCVSANRDLVDRFVRELVGEPYEAEEQDADERALRLVQGDDDG